MNKLFESVKWRGIIKDIINEEQINKIIKENDNHFYIGIDPTADSMHLGHYITIILSKLMNDLLKMTPIFVIGGFTGRIGDPSGKNSERELLDEAILKNNVKKIAIQIDKLAKRNGIENFKIINNEDIYKKISLIDFFIKYGKNFNINQMLAKESVKNRLESGISYTEFSYQIFQAIDFYNLYQEHNVKIQIGGSDQWGNIVSGIDLIKKLNNDKKLLIAGITINLLTDKNGNKIGKTQGKPIWLDQKKTSSYEIYQYFLNMDDKTAMDLIKKITLINEIEYNNLIKEHNKNKKQRKLQIEFARLIITSIHSKNNFDRSQEISKILFKNEFSKLKNSEIENVFESFAKFNYSEETITNFILKNKLLKSKREIREFINSGSIKINNMQVDDENHFINSRYLIHHKYIILSIGKKNKYLIAK